MLGALLSECIFLSLWLWFKNLICVEQINNFIYEGNGISNGQYIASLHPALGQKVQDKIEEKAAALELIFNLTEA